ncbi:MAG: 50S ribosomal protein L29 [Bacteroidetes bacterium]|nr:50S ribosomal protein L29 [Bacteroidota bacterium]MBS1976607.1 50S ribosomal protein L29 [Bacteroidota bacterium]
MKNTIAEIKDLTLNELKEKLVSEKEALRKMKFAHQVSAIENPMKIKQTRRLISRINTLLTEKEKQK